MVVEEVALDPSMLGNGLCSFEPESFACHLKRAQGELLVSEMSKFFAESIAGVWSHPAIEAA